MTDIQPSPDATPPAAPPAASPPEPEAPDIKALLKDRDNARRELIQSQKELERLQKAAREREDAERSDLEKATARIRELEEAEAARERVARDAAIHVAVVSAAARLGFADPEDALRLMDAEAVELVDGKPRDIDRLLSEILKAKPYLKAAAKPADFGQGDRGRQATLTLEQVKAMKTDEINARWDEVRVALGQAGR